MYHIAQIGLRTLVILLLAAAAAFAQAASQPQKPTEHRSSTQDKRVERTREFLGLGRAPDAAAAARGEKLYSTNCAFCHGAKATGAEGPDLVRSSLVLHDEKGETLG